MEIFFSLLTSPQKTIYRISRKEINYNSFWILLLSTLSSLVGFAVISNIPAGIAAYIFTWGTLIRFLISLFALFIASVFYNYFAGVFGGIGSGTKLFKLLPYSFLPFCFVAPVALILKPLSPTISLFLFFLTMVLFILWMLFLQINMIKYIYGISQINSVAVIFLPIFISGTALIIIPLIMIISILT